MDAAGMTALDVTDSTSLLLLTETAPCAPAAQVISTVPS